MTSTFASPELPRQSTRSFSISLEAVGLITVITAAWGGIIPYVGPTFGYNADGTSSWYWNLTHAVLALVPGAVAFLCGLTLMAPVHPDKTGSRRMSLTAAGTLIVLCGAWFVIGPLAWPVLSNVSGYFVAAAPLRNLANHVGYALGPGLLLAACGAFAVGWAARHNQALGTAMRQAPEAPGSEPPAGEGFRTVA
jgi:hypothetical protein